MDLDEAMQERRSIRGFTDDPVSRELLEEILTLANHAPSSMNTQPWHFHVLTGEVLENVRKGNTERMLGGVPPRARSRPTASTRACIATARWRSPSSSSRPWGSNATMRSAGRTG